MKTIKNLLLMALTVAMVFATSCKKNDDSSKPTAPKAVQTIAATYSTKINDLKAVPANGTRTWSMYAKNSSFYANAPLALVKGAEFLTGSQAYNFWSTAGNNPVSFSVSQGVYSNLTPVEPVRLVTETRMDGNGVINTNSPVAYLGVIDFQPATAGFPLTINSFRLGDVLEVNADALTSLPGGENLIITVSGVKNLVDISATEQATSFHGVNTNAPGGQELNWLDVVYNGTAPFSMPLTRATGTGNQSVINCFDGKVAGQVTVTVTETTSGLYATQQIAASSIGQGLRIIISTSKIGWYDSATMGFNDNDITIREVPVVIN